MEQVTINIAGRIGSGKSILAAVIGKALSDAGIAYTFEIADDPGTLHSVGRPPDHVGSIFAGAPPVEIIEVVTP